MQFFFCKKEQIVPLMAHNGILFEFLYVK